MKPPNQRRRFILSGVVLAALLVAAVMLVTAGSARSKARAEFIQCANILSSLGSAARLGAEDNQGVYPPDILSLSNEVATTKALVCPGDKTRSPAARWSELGPASISYEYLASNRRTSGALTNALFRCPIHGHTMYEDGLIRRGDGTVQTGKVLR